MSDDVITYELAAEFRGEGYTWHPSAAPELSSWEDVFGYCLRHQLSPFCVETPEGLGWSVKWSPKSQTQVRGGSLQFKPLAARESRALAFPDEEPLSTIVAMLTTPAPWCLTRASWQLLTEPNSIFARALASVGAPVPEFAISSDHSTVAEALGSLVVPGNYVVIGDVDVAPSAAGRLLLDWMVGESWLADRIGPCQRSWTTVLSTPTRSENLAKLDELSKLSQTKLVGWETCEQVLALMSDVASRWSGASPRWTVHVADDLKSPEIDVVTGTVRVPFEGPRAQKLATRAGADASVIRALAAHRTGDRYVRLLLLIGVAFAIGIVLGFWGGFMVGRRVASKAESATEQAP